jgi:hypothetical protein
MIDSVISAREVEGEQHVLLVGVTISFGPTTIGPRLVPPVLHALQQTLQTVLHPSTATKAHLLRRHQTTLIHDPHQPGMHQSWIRARPAHGPGPGRLFTRSRADFGPNKF